ncbi:MAG TPA: ATP-binding protein [Cyclobacteriaceae bacterium]|nr:ATP-binding protein [Cyclobacteriaceae bacterium]
MEDAVVIVVVTGTAILLLLASFIFAFMWLHQRRNLEYNKEREVTRKQYQEEITKVHLEVKEQTLDHVSQEIHDNVGQILSLAKLNLRAVAPLLAEDNRHKVQETTELIGRAIHDLRSMAKSMSNDYVSRNTLADLLKIEADKVNAGGAMLAHFLMTGTERPIEVQQKLVLYRITQESLSNVYKYSFCDRVEVALEFKPARLILSIRDNGIGFNPDVVKPGLGLSNMKRRAELIGADFQVETSEGAGTTIIINLTDKT